MVNVVREQLKSYRVIVVAHSIAGHTTMYFNVSEVFDSTVNIEEGSYDESDAVRSVALAQKFR